MNTTLNTSVAANADNTLVTNPLVIAAAELLRSAGVSFALYEGTGFTLVRGGMAEPTNMQRLLDAIYPQSRLSPNEADEVLRELAQAGVVKEVQPEPHSLLDVTKALTEAPLPEEVQAWADMANATGVALPKTEQDKFGAPSRALGRHMKQYIARLRNPKYGTQTVPFKGREFDWGQTSEMRNYFRTCLSARLGHTLGKGNYSVRTTETGIHVTKHNA